MPTDSILVAYAVIGTRCSHGVAHRRVVSSFAVEDWGPDQAKVEAERFIRRHGELLSGERFSLGCTVL